MTNQPTRLRSAVFSALVVGAAVLFGAGDALAIIGRPFTPMSYAGVARRTTRRMVYAGAATTAAVATTAAMTAPPPCPIVNGVYQCGGASYRPAYDGPNVVYVNQ